MAENNNHIELLISKSLLGEASIDEQAAIEKWLQQGDENKKLFADYKKAFELGEKHYENTAPLDIDVNKEWAHFNAAISSNKGKVVELTKEDSKMPLLRIAAAVLVIMVSSFLVYNFLFKVETIVRQTAETQKVILLPDSSTVTLNSNSMLSYTTDFNKESRNIELIGEAFFEVARDEEKAFTIRVNEASISVLGTSFNVDAKTSETKVVVATGLVELASIATDKKVQLSAGEVGILSEEDNLTASKNTDRNFNSWKTGIIKFENARLEEVIHSINKIHNVSINLKEGISGDCEVTVSFEKQSLKSILSVLEATLDLTYAETEGKIIITKVGC